MSLGPAPDHSAEDPELAALYALRVLDGDELAGFERHLSACPVCRGTVAQDRRTAAALTVVADEMEPSAGFRERLLRRAAAELDAQRAASGAAATAAPPGQAPAPTRAAQRAAPARAAAAPAAPIPFRPRRPWLQLLAAVLAVLIGGAAVLGVQGYQNQVVASVALQGSTPGSAVVQVRRSGSADLQLQGLPPPPPGQVYEAWVIPPGGQPIPAGTTAAGDGRVSLPGGVQGTTVAVTVETAPGTSAPTLPPILAAPLTV
jgi:anti-sigma-K factor RskA